LFVLVIPLFRVVVLLFGDRLAFSMTTWLWQIVPFSPRASKSLVSQVQNDYVNKRVITRRSNLSMMLPFLIQIFGASLQPRALKVGLAMIAGQAINIIPP